MKLEEPINKDMSKWELKPFDTELIIRKENNHFVVEKALIDPFTMQKLEVDQLAIVEKVDLVEEMKRLVGEEYKRWTKAIDRLVENEN